MAEWSDLSNIMSMKHVALLTSKEIAVFRVIFPYYLPLKAQGGIQDRSCCVDTYYSKRRKEPRVGELDLSNPSHRRLVVVHDAKAITKIRIRPD